MHALARRLRIIPSLGVVAGIVLSLVTVAIDRRYASGLLSQNVVGNGTDVQSILTTIATAVVTLTSVVLTVTLVAVQLAMGQKERERRFDVRPRARFSGGFSA